ncbi:hypothetical protein [Maribacter sp. 2307ULW6-5]|uniref:hypothetical protein n=1 Tax=Maribacter sp. 2307ULW6-5 TaxID=3386275 RepID=UPI0039BD0535
MKHLYPIFLVLLALLTVPCQTTAQDLGNKVSEANLNNPDDVLLMAPPRNINQKAEGSPYIDDTFSPAQVNNLEKTSLMRYNAAQDLMEVMQDDGSAMVLSKAIRYRVALKDGSGKVYENHVFLEDGEKKNGYFIPLGSVGKDKVLYKKEFIKFVKGQLAKSSLEQDIPPRFERTKDRFYVNEGANGDLVELPTSKNVFIKAFPEKNLKSFFKKHRPDLKSPEGLKKVLEHYYGQ